jgi:hypothetical protein
LVKKKYYISFFVILTIGFMWVKAFNSNKLWITHGVINNDIISYYAYLPATFIFNDISLKFRSDTSFIHRYLLWPDTLPNGNLVIKTTMGLAYLYAPFFIGGHLYATLTGKLTDGYSEPYEIALVLSSIFYAITGMFFLRKILLLHFNDVITSLCLLVVALGTNLYNYVTLEPCMSHAYLFCLINIFIWIIYKWHHEPNLTNSILFGLLSGLIVLIRPTNIMVLLLFILFDVKTLKDIPAKIKLFWNKKWLLALSAFLFVLVWLPQFLYWKYISGNWLFFSYVGERFFFGHPHILDGLFGYRKGWLLYTPLMILGIAGIWFMRKKVPELFIGTLFFICISTYVILSWWAWWYGGGFGNRAFIDMYGLLAIAMGSLFAWFGNKLMWIRAAGIVMIFVLIKFQLFQSTQYRNGSIHWDSMTKEAYWDSFLKKYPPPGWYYLLKKPDYKNAKKYGYEKQE